MSDTEQERYIIKYATVDAWSPEMPRIYDSLGNLLAICDDIDAADIILLALNAKPIACKDCEKARRKRRAIKDFVRAG